MKQRLLSLCMALLGIAAGAQAQIAPMVYVGSQIISDGTYEAGDIPALVEGFVTYDGSQKLLTLENATISETGSCGLRVNFPGLTIKIIGQCSITSNSYGFYFEGSTTIDGNGNGKLELKGTYGGIALLNDCTLTISNGADVSAEGDAYGIMGASSGAKLEMTGESTVLWFNGQSACIKDIDLSVGPLKNGYAIYYPAGATYLASTNTIYDADGKEVKNKWVLFQKGIGIYDLNFPDLNFRNWLLKQDYGKDHILTDAEIEGVRGINVYSQEIADLTGIEYFTALTHLDCQDNHLTTLDVSNNKALIKLSCVHNQIRGAGMETLVNSLPEVTDGLLYAYSPFFDSATSNLMTKEQVAVATGKGWRVEDPVSGGYVSGVIPVDATNFPDENFRNWILAQDYGEDGYLNEVEIAAVTAISVYGKSIKSLKGIELFTALTSLYCQYNQLIDLNVSQNTALETLECHNNQLTTLDVSNNKLLIELSCYNNQIRGESMDALVNSLPEVTNGLLYAVSIYVISDNGNLMTKEQVAVATGKGWRVRYPESGGDFSGVILIDATNFPDEKFRNWILNKLDCGIYGFLSDEWIEKVTSINVSGKAIANLKGIEFFTSLTFLNCSNNSLNALDVSQNKSLNTLVCGSNQLENLNVSQNTALTYLDCSENKLAALDVSQNTSLAALTCSGNQIKSLDVSKNTALTEFDCSGNKLTTLDVSKNTSLTSLDCYQNSIRGEGMTALVNSLPETIYGALHVCKNETPEGNDINTLQVKIATDKHWQVMMHDGTNWVEYEGSDPGLPIDATNFPDEKFRNWILAQDYGKDGYLSDTEIAGVTTIDVSNKGIGSLKGIEHFTALTVLQCSMNSLTVLDLSQNTALISLDCSVNSLSALDLSQNTALQTLSCILNGLTTLDLSKNTALTWVACSNNAIRGEGMDAFVNNLPTVTSGELHICNKENAAGNEMTTLQVAAAKAKKWTVLMSSNGTDWVDYAGVKVDAKLTFSAPTASVVYGAALTAPTLTVTPESLKGSVTFSSSNETVAKVSASGEVSVVGAGETTIKATFAGNDLYNGAEASYKLTVTPAAATMAFKTTECSTTVGASFNSPQLTVTPSTLKVKYSSSNTDLATVGEETGVVVAKAEGEVTITATSADANYKGSASYKLTITRNESGLLFASTAVTATYGAAFTAPELKNEHGLTVTYESSDTKVATVDATSGKVTLLKAGETTITAKFAGDGTYAAASASYILTVKKGKATLTFAQTECKGEAGKAFTAPSLTTTPAGLKVTYTSSDASIAKVDAATGAVTIVAEGEVTITATVESEQYEGSASYKITVSKPTVKGDVNGDGRINGTDIQALINFIVDEEDYDETFDINGDEKVNGSDIQGIINIILEEE